MALQVLPAAATAAGQAGAAAVASSAATAGSALAAAAGPIGLGIALISAGISYFSQRKAKKKAKKAARAALVQFLNFDGTNNFIPVVYGARRVEGTLVFMTTNDPTKFGEPNEYLYLVYVLCEGEVNQILLADILVDDLPVSDARFNFANSISINIFPGLDNQTADQDFIDETAEWTEDHELSGLAYITVRLKWDRKAFNNIPTISALVSGKKVFDTRTTTTAFSTNPALCIRDYLTNERYGKGLDVSLIDDTAISAAADFYDTAVTFYPGGTTGKIFEFNAIVDTEQSILDNLKDMMLCCRGFMPYTNGIYQLIPDKSASSVFAFDTDNIISGISIRGENKADKYNRMVCTFTDPTNNYQENTVIWPEAGSTEEIAFLLEDNGTELIGEIDLPYITNFYAARDLARVFLLRSRNAIRTSFNANSDALNVSVGDVVTVTHPTPGWSAKPFQVEEIAINYDGTCAVLLIEYDSSIYSYDPASEQLAYADTDLPNPFSVAAPTSLVVTETTLLSGDGTVVREIDLAWTAADDAFVESYELQFKLSAATDYFSVFTFEPRYVATYGAVGEVYDYRIRAINSLGVSSAFLTGTYTTVGDLTAPATPTGLTISGSYNEAILKWNLATEKDYKETLIFSNTVNSIPATPTLIITGNTVTVFDLAKSTLFYVWLKHVDFSGNISAESTVVTFSTTSGLTDVALADNAVTTPKINASAVTEAKVGTNAITETKIATNAVTSDKINALAVTAAKVAASAIETAKIADLAVETGKLANAAATEAKIATNAITETKISDNAITTPKLIAGAVTAAKITAGTITANEIAASTITGAKIAAGTIQASNIAAGTITASNIAALTITSAEIAGSTITGAKIQALTIEAGNIAAATITGAKIAAGTIEAGNISAGTITGDKISATFTTTSNLILDTNGKLYTSGKTSAASTTAGVFLGYDGVSAYDFAVGDATRSVVYDASAGTFSITNVDINTTGKLQATGGFSFDGVSASIHGVPTAGGTYGVYGNGGSSTGVYGISSANNGVWGLATGTGAKGVRGEVTFAGAAGVGGYFANVWGGTALDVVGPATLSGSVTLTSATANLSIGNATLTGNANLCIKEGVVGSRLDNQILIYGALSDDADTTFGLVTEQAVVANSDTSNVKLKVYINGAAYWLQLREV